MKHTQFLVAAYHQFQRIESVGYRHTVLRADILGVVVFKLLVFPALQEPAGIHYSAYGGIIFFAMLRRYLLKVK